MERPPEPHVEEVHQVRVRDGVVVRRVGADDVEGAGERLHGGLVQHRRHRCVGGGVVHMLGDAGDPFDGRANGAGRVGERARLGEVPNHGEGEAGEGAADCVAIVSPGGEAATAVGNAADRRRQEGGQGLAPLRRVVFRHLVRTAADFLDEDSQCQHLAVDEELAPRVEAVSVYREGPRCARPSLRCRLVRQAKGNACEHGLQQRLIHLRSSQFLVGRGSVLLALLAVHHDGGQSHAQPSRPPGDPQVGHGGHDAATRALSAAGRHGAGPEFPVVRALLRRRARPDWHVVLDAESHAVVARRHRQAHALLALLAQPARFEQRHLSPARRAVRRSRPQIRDRRLDDPARIPLVLQVKRIEFGVERADRHLAALAGFQQPKRPGLVRLLDAGATPPPALPSNRLERRVGRVPTGQLPSRSIQHPVPPRPHVPRKAGRPVPRDVGHGRGQPPRRLAVAVDVPQRGQPLPKCGSALDPPRLQEFLCEIAVPKRERRQRPSPPSHQARIVKRAPQDEPRHRAEVGGHRLAPQPHRLKRNRPAPGKRVKNPGRPAHERFPHILPVRLDAPERLAVRLDPPLRPQRKMPPRVSSRVNVPDAFVTSTTVSAMCRSSSYRTSRVLGSGNSVANNAARLAAKGRRAGQM